MLVCKKCGVSNPLGRVFCGGCGAKLDLAGMTSSTVTEVQKTGWLARHWSILPVSFILVFLAVASLCLFPKTRPIGTPGSTSQAARFMTPLRQLQNLRAGRTLGVSFKEDQINAYLHQKARRLGVDSLSVDIGQTYVAVRLVQSLDPMGAGSFRFTPRFSFDYLFVPTGAVLSSRRAMMGRLTLVGPLKYAAVRKLQRLLSDQDEWKTFDRVDEIKAEDGKLWVKATAK